MQSPDRKFHPYYSECIPNIHLKMIAVFRGKYIEALRQYCYIGGMPEAVAAFAERRDFAEVRRIQLRLLQAEQYVLQQLIADCDIRPFYWTADRAMAEVDFVFQHGSDIVPLEVKAEENPKAKSLRGYSDKFNFGSAQN
jgi:predicted AAA+ superfamily ATPase